MWNIENSYKCKYTVIFTLKINKKKYKNTHCSWKNLVNLFLYDNISEILNYVVLLSPYFILLYFIYYLFDAVDIFLKLGGGGGGGGGGVCLKKGTIYFKAFSL